MTKTDELNNKIEKLEKEKQSILADQSIMYSECLKIAIQYDYKEIIEYLNPSPQDSINAEESIRIDTENNFEEPIAINKTNDKNKKKEIKTIKKPMDLTQYLNKSLV